MSDQANADGQLATSSASNGSEQPSRVAAALACLPFVAGPALGLALVYPILHGWDWALAGLGVLAVSWLGSYLLVSPPWLTRWGKRSRPFVTKIGIVLVWLWLLSFGASLYVAAV